MVGRAADTAQVIHPLDTILLIAALAGAVWSLVLLFLSRPVGKRYLLGALAVLELGLLGQDVAGIVELATTHRHVSGVTFVGYLVVAGRAQPVGCRCPAGRLPGDPCDDCPHESGVVRCLNCARLPGAGPVGC